MSDELKDLLMISNTNKKNKLMNKKIIIDMLNC